MNKDREHALDFEMIRRRKVARRRRKKILIAAGAVLAVALIGAALVWQVAQVTDQDRDFWGNFNASHTLQKSEPHNGSGTE